MKKILFIFLLFSFFVFAENKTPFIIVPYVKHPPTIDGIINEEEYTDFAEITGMVTWGTADASLKTIVPKIQDVNWYLGYDEKYLYISMRSPNPPGVWPIARVKKNDENYHILWDDHTEIQIAKDRKKATFPGIGFYKIMVNPKGFYSDEWYYNGTPGTEGEWSIGGKVACSVNEKYWDMEMSIDIRAFDEKKLDGKRWVLQLLRADAPGGIYFAGWVGAPWMAWEEFGEVLFEKNAPVFKITDLGEISKGDMDLKFEINDENEKEVEIDVNVKDGKGNVIYNKEEKFLVKKGETKKLNFKGNLDLTEKGNLIEISAFYYKDENGEKKKEPLYYFSAPIIKLTDEFFVTHIKPWLEMRPKGDYDWNFSYWPSYNVAEVSVDFDFFGLKEELEKAKNFKISVRDKNGKVFGSRKEEIKNKYGYTILKNLNLTTGDYIAEIEIFDEKGKTIDKRQIEFTKKKYEWEGNRLGISDKVIPPYTPIKRDGREFEIWGRKYLIGENGLFERILASGGNGYENILSGKVEVIGKKGEKELKIDGSKLNILNENEGKVEIESNGKLENLDVKTKGVLEYDGWYEVYMEIIPKGKAEIDQLILNIPLWKNADTIYIQRAGDGRRGNKFGALPEGTGLIWESKELLPFYDWGSFVPIVFVGNGDKGLWWFAEENRDWTMSDKKSAVEIYRRENGDIELKINIIADKTLIDKKRKIHFAFLIDPVKQIPDERKWAWGKLEYGHNTFGYRYYGGSVDGFENTDTDLEELRKVFLAPTWEPKLKTENKSCLNHINYFRNQAYNTVGMKNKMFVLYGSGELTGLGLDAFDTYGGEWLGKTNWKPFPQTEFTGWINSQGTKEWKTDRDLTTVGVNWTDSFTDCFVWHHYKLLSKVPVNGTWWDNTSIYVIKDYDPEREEFYKRFNVFTRRRLTKRLNNIGYELGRTPWWINNMHVDWSFCQVSWHIENDFYIDNADMTMMDNLNVDEFRALCRIKRGIIHRVAIRGPEGTNEQIRKQGRSIIGMCLLHDIGTYYWGFDRYFSYLVDMVDGVVGYFSGAEFIPYWRNKNLINIKTDKVYASIYKGKGKAVIVVVNQNREDKDVEFEINDGIIEGKKITRIYDLETKSEFGRFYDNKEKRNRWGEFGKAGVFGIGGGEVRFIVVE
ncbi:MAG: glycoside hydrolase domain-containing protein [Candidatus Ratteibacteria bacterium]